MQYDVNPNGPRPTNYSFVELATGRKVKYDPHFSYNPVCSQNSYPFIAWDPSKKDSQSNQEDYPTKWRFCFEMPGEKIRQFYLKPPLPEVDPANFWTTTSGHLLFIKDNGVFFTSKNSKMRSPPIGTIAEVDPKNPLLPPVIHHILWPDNCPTGFSWPSPSGKKLLLSYRFDITPPLSSFIRKIIPKFLSRRKSICRLDVCDIDGKNLHEIAHYNGASLDVMEINWLPDEKAVSFTRNGKLYVLPVD